MRYRLVTLIGFVIAVTAIAVTSGRVTSRYTSVLRVDRAVLAHGPPEAQPGGLLQRLGAALQRVVRQDAARPWRYPVRADRSQLRQSSCDRHRRLRHVPAFVRR